MDRLPVIVINFDAIEMTERCLDHLARYTDRQKIAVVAVDNGSANPANLARLKELADSGLVDRVIPHPGNIGFSSAVNDAVSVTEGGIFCVLNNDCLVEEGWLAAALTALGSDPRVAAVCANVYSSPDRRRPSDDEDVGQLYGALMFFRRVAWTDVGEFDAEHFSPAYGEELDWSYRAIRRGYRIRRAGRSLAHHIGSYTANKCFQPDVIRLIRLTHRIQVRLFNWPWPRLLAKSWGIYLDEWKFEIKNGTARLLIRAIFHTLLRLPRLWPERRKRMAVGSRSFASS